VDLRIATLPAGLDPCDLLTQEGGLERFKGVLQSATDALDFKLSTLLRSDNPALQHLDLTFLETESDHLLAYYKQHEDNEIVVVANLDPFAAHEGLAIVPSTLGLSPAFTAHDLLTGERFPWRIGRNFVRLEPGEAHVIRIRR